MAIRRRLASGFFCNFSIKSIKPIFASLKFKNQISKFKIKIKN
jgi:hypothetical protein